MSRNRIVFDGLDELRAQLRNLPAHLTDEANEIVSQTMEDAQREIVARYPSGPSGNLKRLVSIVRTAGGKFVAGGVLRNRAPHAYLYEHGTQTRQTALGYNRGKMPPKPTFIPIVIRKRREMYTKLKAMLGGEGFTVTGDA